MLETLAIIIILFVGGAAMTDTLTSEKPSDTPPEEKHAMPDGNS